ncbi:MAG: MarR family transcriptional regulator [Aminobacterium sp.]|jgi:DNA-binding MarR family transcriptional regulator|uniref:MarR family winged helix-turn-helix transcriptional regulator n=1 Tax=Aminobacterium sp. TaxID=1872491 RepID=UPI001BD164DF|nr:MarR family transcriptional regulator [Aminobacterium sp.]MDD2206911.1 MarR family transcriptional regulator [Aminobacterium sp.]MDD3425553.1 MarR family transcriptional regulator [Aminobacterium sp.]MDD4552383.1 MarR family transcriptional regulator [Aminobacterium sp.]MEA4877957.1 MarR family transcriptional regulator [Aminobacterium sp.]
MLRQTQDLAILIEDIVWQFSGKSFNEECCGNLSYGEYRALYFIYQHGNISISELSEKLVLTKSGGTRLVNRLEEKEYAERKRNSRDGRVCCVGLTAKGEGMAQSLHQSFISRIDNTLKTLDDPLRDVVIAGFKIFKKALSENGENNI